ncbi:MAG: Glu/Leu/Phe/Val dehydrogenase, partial [Leptolyngbya sp. SIO3F4]|nr:Glu/Leu/Phe/Val dehydrogenase [Leptolyngbya sp. SIO3F4]
MMDQYSIIRQQRSPAVITGKPVALGGSLGRFTATGTGAFYVLEAILTKLSKDPAGTVNSPPKTVAVQGFGNAGSVIARHLFNAGYTVVAVSDSRGGIYTPEGLDIPSIQKFKADTRAVQAVYCDGSVCSLVEHETITNAELLNLDVDILIPAALENQITAVNANAIQARYIFEVANGPISADADDILEAKGITVFPDILVNAGGVTVSYFEWVQNRSGLYWSIDEVNNRLKQHMVTAAETIWHIAQTYKTSVRTAAYIHALTNLGEAMDARGTRADYVGNK